LFGQAELEYVLHFRIERHEPRIFACKCLPNIRHRKFLLRYCLRMLYLLRKLMPLNLRSVLYRFLNPPEFGSKR
ncbi:MAG: hypothetical protein CL563_05965, partial [Alphaproteobacteria bacterium]|nr:hypothetical protein [Alphaproteobacteria bacterium]